MSVTQFSNLNTILFDLDGTLLNTLEDLADSVNHVLKNNHFPTRTLDEICYFVGNGVATLIKLALPADCEEAVYNSCLFEFRSYYAEHMQIKTIPYPGILSLLKHLKEKGFHLGIVSNKFDGAVKNLSNTYFSPYIDTAIGETNDLTKKPAPDMIYRALTQLQADPQRAIYVGDSDVDLETARNAALPCISVTWGFRTKEELEKAGASILVATPEELCNLFPTLI